MNMKRLFQIIRRWPVYLWLYVKGVTPGRWNTLYKDLKYDFFHYKKTTLKQKLWAYKRGFLSERIERYGLNEENYKDYLSDFDHFKRSSYVNKQFSAWFDNKLTTWYILQPFSNLLPKHYFYVEKQKVHELDKKEMTYQKPDVILNLLEEKGVLAFKKTSGGHGLGFIKAAYKDGEYKVNNKPVDRAEMKKIIANLNGYIVTEYLYDDPRVSELYAGADEDKEGLSPAVMRIATVFDEDKGAVILSTAIRIPAAKSGLLTDYDGSLYSGIRHDTGEFFRPLIMAGDFETAPCGNHPDTGKKLEGFVMPNWNTVIENVLKISDYLSSAPYLTYDVVMTEKGMKILEINSHGLPRPSQPFYPFLANESARKLFKLEE